MKNPVSFLIAGAMFATLAFAQNSDAGAGARAQAKTGHEAPQPETARCCGMKKCLCADKCCGTQMCHRDETSSTVSHTDAEQRFFAKNGQYPPSDVTSSKPAVQAAAAGTAGTQMDCCKHQHQS